MSTSATNDSNKPAANEREQKHAWEAVGGHQWESVQEDEHGNIISSSSSLDAAELIRRRRRRLARTDYSRSHRRLVRDMIRYLYLVIDLSRWTREKDPALPPKTRLELLLSLAMDFVSEFYDQNPLSHLGIVVLKDGEAEMLTQLSGSTKQHRVALAAALTSAVSSSGPGAGGEFSLQNGLEVAGRSLGHMPRYGSREIVVMCAALSTCDPGDVLVETLPRLRGAGARVSCVALSAEMHVCRKIADETGGVMGVCLDKDHLRDLIMGQTVPPPSVMKKEALGTARTCEFVSMGFPTRETGDVPSLIHATRDKKLFARTGYLCPRCKAKASDLPMDCAVCGLKLVLAPHLARSFHHLFPVPPFVEVPEDMEVGKEGEKNGGVSSIEEDAADAVFSSNVTEIVSSSTMYVVSSGDVAETSKRKKRKTVEIDNTLLVSSKDSDRCCYACLKVIGVSREEDDAWKSGSKKRGKSSSSGGGLTPGVSAAQTETLRFQCPDCLNVFCADCDAFLHGTLHNCPGCLCR